MCERVVEFYSGIGGMHFALKESGIRYKVVAAVDINDVANKVYKHNFPDINLLQRSIESISLKEMNKQSPTMFLMSPPCQPFTRVGLQKDAQDARTSSFLYLLETIPKLDKLPEHILIENVKGFECSETRDKLVSTLKECGYTFQEFLLTPLQFGVPNSRLRYYMMAKKKPLTFAFDSCQTKALETVPPCAKPFMTHLKMSPLHDEVSQCSYPIPTNRRDSNHSSKDKQDGGRTESSSIDCEAGSSSDYCVADEPLPKVPRLDTNTVSSEGSNEPQNCYTSSESNRKQSELCTKVASDLIEHQDGSLKYCERLNHYLEKHPEESFEDFLLPEKDLKRFKVMDIVQPFSRKSCCFTKRYGHYMEGAGSVLQMTSGEASRSIMKEDMIPEKAIEFMDDIKKLKLRYFTPREIANLMCFPPEFTFPDKLSRKQCYRVLGNSLNVHVVAVLIKLMTMDCD